MNNETYKIETDAGEIALEMLAISSITENKGDKLPDINKLATDLKRHLELIQGGNMIEVENSLYSQALILQDFFRRLMRMSVVTTHIDHLNTLGHLALKAQNQSRTTLATLADIKNPRRATFIKQQNNAVNQQINNSENFQEKLRRANELLTEGQKYETLDFGRAEEAIGNYQELEAMVEVNRRKNQRRKRKKQNECL
jgi:hypothetical protein